MLNFDIRETRPFPASFLGFGSKIASQYIISLMKKLLIICGPTATGKTGLGVKIAARVKGEIISADSRQVYRGMDIVTGKDLPLSASAIPSHLQSSGRVLDYYMFSQVPVWLLDVVDPDEAFSVSDWKDAAEIVISHLHASGKLPVVVGGTGLFIKSLTENLETLHIPPNSALRDELTSYTTADLFCLLANESPEKASSLNSSDRSNPRRLVRAIEIARARSNSSRSHHPFRYDVYRLGLTAPVPDLKKRITDRVNSRILEGAESEIRFFQNRYPSDLPSMTGCGYRLDLSTDWQNQWAAEEHKYLKRQLTWFSKQSDIHWFDVTKDDWQDQAMKEVIDWYANRTGTAN